MQSFVNGINTRPVLSDSSQMKSPVSSHEAQSNFANTLQSAIEHVNDTQVASDKKTEALAKGQINDLHDVMITAQKASISLETSVQVQRKVIDAYNEIMRMQI
ncbi:flagellar hook-basal body complex protein FliE [Lentibacillus cibarius]|uniref:Flagellar hook-basal body complex protein FliE n=1 Tax=Lentibacillus cibarius TaxID=2583219 RepID=A0A5S3QP22_9BACI|nr:flagellar hook-basal body complex protein FliE [Lentibacillus cibarius]TMN23575.1 flagellar hook-basal body complex protein FliE [Lentibacillus cibarius]